MVLKNNHSVGLDLLRVVSSLLVFIPHLLISFLEKETGNLYIISSIGVELFFCLSGYLICKQGFKIFKTYSSKSLILSNAFIFVVRRTMRTWPAYFFVLIAYTIFYKFTEKELLYYWIFFQNLYYPLVAETFFEVSWSIAVEEVFYFIYPLTIIIVSFIFTNAHNKLAKPIFIIFLSLFFIILLSFVLREYQSYENWGADLRRIAVFRLDAIAFGGIGYFLNAYLIKSKKLKILLFLLVLTSLAVIYSNLNFYAINGTFFYHFLSKNINFYIIYIFFVSIVILFDRIIVASNPRLKSFLNYTANLSYPFYLLHVLVIDLIKEFNFTSITVNIILISLICLLISVFIRKFIEEDILKFRPKYKS